MVVIVIAVLMATTLTRRITFIIQGIRQFQDGDLGRLSVTSNDEMGQLANVYNDMADTLERHVQDLESSKKELVRHRDNLEELVLKRTRELEEEIVERKRIEGVQHRGQVRLQTQNQAFLRLASDESLHKGEFNAAMQVILTTAAEKLAAERGSIWLFDPHRLYANCLERYSLRPYTRTRGSERGYRLAEHADYLRELRAGRSIANSDLSPGRQLFRYGTAGGALLSFSQPIHALLRRKWQRLRRPCRPMPFNPFRAPPDTTHSSCALA